MLVLLNSVGVFALLFVSVWLLYLNFRILKVTEHIHNLTNHIDQVSVDLCILTERMVENTSLPSNYLSKDKG